MNKKNRHPADGKKPITIFGPDFPFAFDDWLDTPQAWAASRPSTMVRKWQSWAPVSPAWWRPTS